MKKAIFIDRDGVINEPIIINKKPFSPKNLEEFKVIKHVDQSLKILKKLNFLTIIVTNQPDIKKKNKI